MGGGGGRFRPSGLDRVKEYSRFSKVSFHIFPYNEI